MCGKHNTQMLDETLEHRTTSQSTWKVTNQVTELSLGFKETHTRNRENLGRLHCYAVEQGCIWLLLSITTQKTRNLKINVAETFNLAREWTYLY